jgi:protein SCO1
MGKTITWIGVSILFIIFIAFFSSQMITSSTKTSLPVVAKLPDFDLVDQYGQPFKRSDLNGKVTVVAFIFTRCKGPCPVMTAEMTELYKRYEYTDKVQFVSITVDPEYDSLAVLKDYAGKQGVKDHRWKFLTGKISDIASLSEKGFLLPIDVQSQGHSAKFILVDQDARIRGYYSSGSRDILEALKTHIEALVQS